MTFAPQEKIAGSRREPIAYIARTRAYYAALGYLHPYAWAHNATVPFHRPSRRVSELTVALVTTAAPFNPDAGDQGPDAPYNASAKFYRVYSCPSDRIPDLRISHVTYDRTHTRPTDIGAYLPLAALWAARANGDIGALAPRLFGLPTNRSQRTTREVDAPALLQALRADGADVAILVPNCPVCHQSVTLAARHLEENRIATVVMGAARDIVEAAGAPRFLFSDVPLGNAAGRPHDRGTQILTLDLALRLIDEADTPGTVWTSPLVWAESDDWKQDFMRTEGLTVDAIAQARAAHDHANGTARELRTGA